MKTRNWQPRRHAFVWAARMVKDGGGGRCNWGDVSRYLVMIGEARMKAANASRRKMWDFRQPWILDAFFISLTFFRL